jgi:hypothetical protein
MGASSHELNYHRLMLKLSQEIEGIRYQNIIYFLYVLHNVYLLIKKTDKNKFHEHYVTSEHTTLRVHCEPER